MKTDRKHPASPELRSLIQTLIKIDRGGSVLWHDKAASSECLMWGQRPKDSEHQPLLSQVQWYSVGAKAEQLGTLIGARTCEVTTAAPIRGIVFFLIVVVVVVIVLSWLKRDSQTPENESWCRGCFIKFSKYCWEEWLTQCCLWSQNCWLWDKPMRPGLYFCVCVTFPK